MTFLQKYTPSYFICDKSHRYIVSSVVDRDGINVNLCAIDKAEAIAPVINWYEKLTGIETIYRTLNLLKPLAGKYFRYGIVGSAAQNLTLDGFEIVKGTNMIEYEVQPEEVMEDLYNKIINEQMRKKRCRLNNAIKKLNINVLSDEDIFKLETMGS